MADTIHKNKKNWPHFDKLYLGSDAYAEGYSRIFGSKNETTSGIQKRSKRHSEETGDKPEKSGSHSRVVHKKSQRKSKKAQP